MIRRTQLRCTALTLILLMAGMLACIGAANAAAACCPVTDDTRLTPCCCEIESEAALPAFSDSGLFFGFAAALPAVPVLFTDSPRISLAQSLQHQALTPNQRRRYLDLGRLLN